jgi:cytochrome c
MRRWSRTAAAKLLYAALAGVAILLAWNTPQEQGKELFERRCSGCHALNNNKEGPRLRGVYGRKSASLPDFAYSGALQKAGVVWDEKSLDRWLSDPDAMAPDTDMTFRLGDGDERRAVIAYLKSLRQ